MKTRKKLLPGQPGTKKLVSRYGEDLICVRYRCHPDQQMTVKTVELVIERIPFRRSSRQIPPDKRVCLHIRYGEADLGKKIRAAGGKWNRERKVWELDYESAAVLELTDRIIDEEGERDDPGPS